MKKLNDMDLQTIYCRTLASVMNEVLTLQQLADDTDLPVFEDIFASLQCVGNPVTSLGDLPEESEPTIDEEDTSNEDIMTMRYNAARINAMMDIWWHCAHAMILTIYSNQGAHPLHANISTATMLAGIIRYNSNGDANSNYFFRDNQATYMDNYSVDEITLIGSDLYEDIMHIANISMRLATIIHLGSKALNAIAQDATDCYAIIECYGEDHYRYQEMRDIINDIEEWPIECSVDEYAGYWSNAIPYITVNANNIMSANQLWNKYAKDNQWMNEEK